MKTLYLLRHAKSSWKYDDLSDIDRPLNKRGKENAPKIGQYLKKKKVNPQIIISSPSKRTLSTAEIISNEIGYKEKNLRIEMKLYAANLNDLIELVNKLGDNLNEVMLVGHNPSFTLAVEYFSGELLENLPTCGCAKIDFAVNTWRKVGKNNGKIKFLISPKSI